MNEVNDSRLTYSKIIDSRLINNKVNKVIESRVYNGSLSPNSFRMAHHNSLSNNNRLSNNNN